MIRIHKEIRINGIWEHEGCSMLHLDDDKMLSVLGRYFIGTPMLDDELFGSTVTALDYAYSKKYAKAAHLLRADDISRLRKVWPAYFTDFDKEVGYFLWESGDIWAYPEEMAENNARHFTDYRMFIWLQ